MAKILYWTGAGIGNLIQATPAFYELIKHGHDLTVYPEDVPVEALNRIYPYNYQLNRPNDSELCNYSMVIYSEFRGSKNPPKGKNVVSPKMKWWKESESEYHLRIIEELFSIKHPLGVKFLVKPTRTGSIKNRNIALCPGGKISHNIKKWPYFHYLSRQLILRKWNVYIVGDSKDIKFNIDWGPATMMIGQPFNMVGDLLIKMNMVVANDCGLMHYAHAIGIPTYCIIGPTSITKNIPSTVTSISNDFCEHRPCQEKFKDWSDSPRKRCKLECLEKTVVSNVLDAMGILNG